jgi:hypothetical protein
MHNIQMNVERGSFTFYFTIQRKDSASSQSDSALKNHSCLQHSTHFSSPWLRGTAGKTRI